MPFIESINYSFSGTNATIIGFNGDTAPNHWNLVIPSVVNYLDVSYNVTNIDGDYAFLDCSNLISITIPYSVTNINNYSFWKCYNLTNIVIKSYFSNLPIAFHEIDNPNTSWTFDYSGSIPESTCNNRKGVTSVVIGDEITSIEDDAFAACSGLTSITLPPALRHIGHSAFAITSITSIIIPDTIISIDDYAFGSCPYLTYIKTNVYLPNLGITFFGTNPLNSTFIFDYSGSIPDTTCNQKFGLTTIYIGDNITSIERQAFIGCSGLTNIFISPSVTYIGDKAFADCTNLISMPLPKNIASFGNDIFLNSPARFIATSSFVLPPQILSDGSYTIIDPVKPLNSTNNWIYTSLDTSIATINDNNIIFVTSGLVTITATLQRDNLYAEINLIYPLSISGTNEPSSFIFTDPKVINDILLSTRPEEDNTIVISSEAITPELLATTNPPDGTDEEKESNRENVVSNIFSANTSTEAIIVPVEMIFISSEIDTSEAESITILNTTNTTAESPIVIDASNVNTTDIIFCLIEKAGNTVRYEGIGEFIDYFFIVTKNANNTFTIIQKSPLNTEIIIANKGDIFYYAGFKYVIGSITAQLAVDPNPIVTICFPAGTPILTDQGNIAIEKININKNTIRGKKIVAITKTTTIEDKIVCIEKDAFGPNIPSQKTYISRNHKLFYNKQMIKAKKLIGKVDGVYNKKYNGELLYNILLETYEKMLVNNIIVETLHPDNFIAKIYNSIYTQEEKNNIIVNINNCARDYKKTFGVLK